MCFTVRSRRILSLNQSRSNIILALLSTGEAYITDLRKEHRSRVELCEIQVQEDSDDEGHSNRSRYPYHPFMQWKFH